ncbi:hypothetical protein [Embleya sp. NPDC059259]|uniref:hypothetical protein n=1 Tax=unclassified Embleya TaxID=2699296 RepID=UPI0036A81640
MPFTLVQPDAGNPRYRLDGVFPEPEVEATLGTTYWKQGPHWIGFDEGFSESVVVRAYFDPAEYREQQRGFGTDPAAFRYVGYLQCAQFTFLGTPITPAAFGGRVADRQPYVFDRTQKYFVDLVDPANARACNIPVPLYAFNSLLTDGDVRSIDDLYVPHSHGALWASDPDFRYSEAAVLTAEVPPGLLTPDAVGDCLTPDNLVLALPVTPAQLAHAEPYQLALRSLATTALPGDDAPWLPDLVREEVAAQVVGRFVLLTLPDDEELGDTLVIYSRPGFEDDSEVCVHVLSEYDMAELVARTGNEALWRIKEHLDPYDLGLAVDGLAPPPQVRGARGLLAPPFAFPPETYPLELTYWMCAVGVRGRGTATRGSAKLLSAVRWSALYRYDDDRGRLVFGAVRPPRWVDDFDVPAALRRYDQAKREAPTGAGFDTGNFTLAALKRDRFGAGPKPVYG